MEIIEQIAQCVKEPGSCVTMVQFWVAVGTGLALVTGFVRWVVMKWKRTTVDDRLERIEGGIKVGKQRATTSNDCDLVRAHRTLFTRPAFTRRCVSELSIPMLTAVMDETLAALSTGTHYDSKRQVRSQFSDLHAYRSKGHRANIGVIYQHLQQLQWLLKEFDQFLRHCPGAHYPPDEFISRELRLVVDGGTWQQVLDHCDGIDIERNNVITAFNAMLEHCGEQPLPLIVPLSSGRRMEPLRVPPQ
jgi:hypothetical protein